MKNNNPKFLISIITPVLNRVQFLEKAILSIKNQDYPHIEHIIMDGDSTDGTLDIIKKYEGKYNMKWFSEKDNGLYNALNKGFKIAKGDILCWLDSDDVYLSGTIKRVVNVFQKNPDIDVVFGNILISDENDKIINHIKHTDFDINVLIYLGMNLNPQATFWKKSLHDKIGGLNEGYRLSADRDFFIRMGLSGAKFYHIKKLLSIYRFHVEQITSKFTSIAICEDEEITKKYGNKNINSCKFRLKKIMVLMNNFLKYIKQGDVYYIFRSFLNRVGILDLKP